MATTNDPVADLVTRIRNAGAARLERCDAPVSKVKLAVLAVLKREGYIDDFRVSEGDKPFVTVWLRYARGRDHAIEGIRRRSTPGCRRYVPARSIPIVRDGMGISVISTSQGVMSDREARQKNVGGELLLEVW
jgi:small subunit ribosomal protein S8